MFLIDIRMYITIKFLQEIQWAIKNTAAKVFNDLINEGKYVNAYVIVFV